MRHDPKRCDFTETGQCRYPHGCLCEPTPPEAQRSVDRLIANIQLSWFCEARRQGKA